MGTNFYHRTNICESCGRYDEKHIGKVSMGWTFSFRGYDDPLLEDQETIRSYADWLKRFEADGKIFDEYDEEMSLDEFKAMVEELRTRPNNHTLYCRVHYPGKVAEKCWLDDEGNSFDRAEFS